MLIKNNGEKPEGIIFSNLAEICEPQSAISETPVVDKWLSVTYETANISGTMLAAYETVSPQTVTLSPKLTGWYKIYVSMMDNPANRVYLKLTNDEAQSTIIPSTESFNWTMMKWDRFQECFWKCADMTNQNIEISRRTGMGLVGCYLGWLRFVPMTEEEVEIWKNDEARTDTKRLFVTSDMYSVIGMYNPTNFDEWNTLVENMKHSDVEIFAIDEDIVADGLEDRIHPENYAYLGEMRKVLNKVMFKKTKAVYDNLIETGHRAGMKMYLSKRMGAKVGPSFPYNGEYVDLEFGQENPHLYCKNRDGVMVDALSYAYPEVQEHMLETFRKMAKLDCDGVNLVFTRGVPYVLFEEPVCERFKKSYPDVNPCELPLADERIQGLHCEIITEFMRRLREALDDECEKMGRRPMKIHAYVGSSLAKNRFLGLDVEQWAKEKLIDSFSAYPLEFTEKLEGLMQEDNPELIDLEKYTRASRENFHKVFHRDVEYSFTEDAFMYTIKPHEVTEYVEMANKYGIKVYFDILDRLKPSELYIREAKTLIEAGAENFSLWDVDARAETKAQWETASRLGHVDDIRNGAFKHETATLYRIFNIGGKNIGIYNPTWMG